MDDDIHLLPKPPLRTVRVSVKNVDGVEFRLNVARVEDRFDPREVFFAWEYVMSDPTGVPLRSALGELSVTDDDSWVGLLSRAFKDSSERAHRRAGRHGESD